MTMTEFDRGTYGAMTLAELVVQFERIVGEAPEKRNRLWMLKRMEQAFTARAAADRATLTAATTLEESDPSATAADLDDEILAPTADPDCEQGESTPSQVASPGAPAAVIIASDPPVASDPPAEAMSEALTNPVGHDVAEATGEAVTAAAPPSDIFLTVAGEGDGAFSPEPVVDGVARAPVEDGVTGGYEDPLDRPGAPLAVDSVVDLAMPPSARGAVEDVEEDGRDVAPDIEMSSGPSFPASAEKPARRAYVPLRFRTMSLPELHALYASTVGRPTKSVDVSYLAWKIKRAEQTAGTAPTSRRRPGVTADGVSRGEAKAITLREYPDTIAALGNVCARHGFRSRLDFFRVAARFYLDHLGEAAAATHFCESNESQSPHHEG
jgi:hypothetical protein